MLLFNQKTVVFLLLSKDLKLRTYLKQEYYLLYCRLWDISYVKGASQSEIIWKQDPTTDIWRVENVEWRKLHNNEHYWSYRSANIVRLIKYENLWWTVYEARMVKLRTSFKILAKFSQNLYLRMELMLANI